MDQPLNLTNPEAINKFLDSNKGEKVNATLILINGVYGEFGTDSKYPCYGFAEEIIDTPEKLEKYGLDPEEGGTFVKLIGCSYLYKGFPKGSDVTAIEQAKGMISTIPREIIGRSWVYSAATIALAIFAPKRLIRYAFTFFDDIKIHSLRHYMQPEMRMKQSTREVRLAFDRAVKYTLGIPLEKDLYNAHPPHGSKEQLGAVLARAWAFFTLIADMDSAYGFILQDTLGEIDQKAAAINPRKELLRVIDLAISRNENLTVIPGISERTEGIPYKLRFLRKVLGMLLFVSPKARKIARRFMVYMDLERVKLDEADWYFVLRRNTHNFRGVPIDKRLEELERIDKEKGHFYIKVESAEPTL